MEQASNDNNDYYEHSGSAQPNSSDSNSEDDLSDSVYAKTSPYFPYYTNNFDVDGPFPRFIRVQNTEDDDEVKDEADEEESEKVTVDPGLFRYNKRVFITALPCLLLILVMTGESLLFLLSIGGLVLVLMNHMGEDVSKRCVVVFALFFIPCQVLVIGTVLPLLWLSIYNLVLVGLVNVFFIMTGGWIILQFVAFRREEHSMCIMIEQMLFTLYPYICSGLVTWVLSTVVSTPMVPFIFTLIWFVCLQLYLMPATSSFKSADSDEDDFSVLQESTVFLVVAAFVISGPVVHIVLTLTAKSSEGIFSLSFLSLLLMLVCLDIFLATLLSLRQLCQYYGVPHLLMMQVRWVSGAGMLVLCYPVLQRLGLESHFLLSLPVAAAGFTALALTFSLKKGKVTSLLLMACLMMLMFVWLSHLPWGLTYYFLGTVPLRSFYLLVAGNFVLCVLCIFASWHNSMEVFGLLLLLQTTGITVCEIGLYQAGLYSLLTFQITGLVAAYTFHRLHAAGKLSRTMATFTSAIQLTKTALTALRWVVMDGGDRAGPGPLVGITAFDFLTLLLFMGVLVWIFVYETKEEVTLLEAGKHLGLLLLSMGVSAQSFLVPVGLLVLPDDPTLPDLVGLWYGLGGVLVLLYALQHSQCPEVLEELTKVAMVLGGVGVLVMVMQPQFDLSLYALYHWSEVSSILLVAALLATGVEVGLRQTLVSAAVLGVCPGIHVALLLYGEEVTLLHLFVLAAITCTLLALVVITVKIQNVTDTIERVLKIGTVTAACLLVTVVVVDVVNLERPSSVWNYPAWKVGLCGMVIISVSLKTMAMKLGPRLLPLTKKEDHSLPLIPVIGNTATIVAFLLARTQGPEDGLLHDLWCSASAVFLIALQRDSLLFTSLSPSNRATPTVLAAVGTLVVSTLLQSRFWLFDGVLSAIMGLMEILTLILSLPLYVVLAGIMWRGEIWSEKAVVFALPLNAVLFLLGTGFTSWALCIAGFVCGISMMMFKLPLLPYNYEVMQR